VIDISKKMTVSILGCGWYGRALGRALTAKGMTVKGSTTSADKLSALADFGILPFEVRAESDSLSADPAFFDCDVLVVSIPPRFRRGETADYLPKIGHIIGAIKQYGVRKVIYTSSTGVYGDTNSEVNELSVPQPEPGSGTILLETEKLFTTETAFKTAILRFGGLIGEGRDPGRFFAGKTQIPNGRAPVNLVQLEDCVGVTEAIIMKDAFGYVFNTCSPEHPPKAGFYRAAAAKAGLPPPDFIDELLDWKIVLSVNIPAILGYRFTGTLID